MPYSLKGLTSKEAEKLLKKFGPNILPEKPPPSDISIFLKQIKSPLVYILITAGVITFAFQKISDTIVISLSVLVNTILGYFQERRASKALYALKRLIHPATKVLRDNEQKTIDVSQVVCGDVAILNQGSKVPADGKIVEASRLFIEEAILTGESTPVGKKEKDTVFMGTIVTSGQGRMLVESTGAATQIGKIAKSVQEPSEDTPLKRQLSRFSRQLTLLVVILTVLVFFIGLVSRRETLEIFEASVALAVSAIPEGLLVGLTVVLAIGMQRILKRKGLVRNLVSAETLGGVTTICIDKTGTLTEGRLRVVDVIGNNDELIKQSLIANDLDDPIVIAAYEWASKTAENHRFRAENYERLDTIPFSSKDRFFATLARWDEAHNMIFVNGAPEFLARWSNLEGRKLVEINRKIEELSMQGKRVIGFARRKVKTSKVRLRGDDIKDDLEWVGMMAFSDPVRKGVKTALFKAKQAGIKLVVITGDYAQTAISVMHQLGITIKSSEIILGEEVEKLSIPMLTSRLAKDSEVKLFARTTPEQKLNIVKALKLGGEAVAMTGDGVNDAPALKRADIGVVVGDATDVARESADLVLLDSRFETILAAVEEGRGIFDNVRKIILYLMSDAFQGIIVIVGAMILGLPLPVTAAQILWINLISDGFPDLALTVDPINPGVMKKPPRASSEPIVSSWMRSLIVIVSISGGLLALAVFAIIYNASSQNLALSQSVAFAVLGINSLVYVFSIRTLKEPFWKSDLFGNRWLVLAVVAGLVLQLSPFVVSPVGEFLGVVPIGGYWIGVVLSAILIFVLIEQSKLLFKGVLGGKRGK